MRNGRPVILNAILNNGRVRWILAGITPTVCAPAAITAPSVVALISIIARSCRTKHCGDNRAVDRDPGHLFMGLESSRDATRGKKEKTDGKGNNLEAIAWGGGRRWRRWSAAK